MSELVLENAVILTDEAIFDYGDIFTKIKYPILNKKGERIRVTAENFELFPEPGEDVDIPIDDIKDEMETYINSKFNEGKLLNTDYFRIKYFDEINNDMVMLFIHKGGMNGTTRLWNVVGVCLASDYDEDLEYCGMIRNWLNTAIVDLPEEPDWVVLLRFRQEEERLLMEELWKI